jgi:Methyltransferase domain
MAIPGGNAVGGICAEIGVFKGDFTRDILRVTRSRTPHLIDPWSLLGESYEHPWFAHMGESKTREAHRQVERLAAEHPELTIHVGRSQEVLPGFPDAHFDWVYLDSSHEYEQTLEELGLLRQKVKPAGIIAGHDWFEDPDHQFHGVYRAVNEFCARYGWDLFQTDIFDQWAIRKR